MPSTAPVAVHGPSIVPAGLITPSPRAWLHTLPVSTAEVLVVPLQARRYDYQRNVTACTNVEQLSIEWYGTNASVGASELEERYGEGKPGIPHGGSWRGKKLRENGKSLNSLFCMMNSM